MNINPQNLLFTLLGGLLLAAILAWIRKSRLTIVVPRLFSYSALSAKGQLAEISIFNRGFKTEELIEIDLGVKLKYEIVGSNNTDIVLTKNNKLSISRIGPGDDVTTILLVEGGSFDKNEIVNCLSKESKGHIVNSLNELPPTGPQRIAIVCIFVVLPVITYLGLSFLRSEFNYKGNLFNVVDAFEENAERKIVVNDWSMINAYKTLKKPLFIEFEAKKININIGTTKRKKDSIAVPITFENLSSFVITASLEMNTQWSAEKIPSYDRSINSILISPGSKITKTINVIIPNESVIASDKKVYIDLFLKEFNGDSLGLNRVYLVKE